MLDIKELMIYIMRILQAWVLCIFHIKKKTNYEKKFLELLSLLWRTYATI